MSYKTRIDAAAWELYDQVLDNEQEDRTKAIVTALVIDCITAERERVLAEFDKLKWFKADAVESGRRHEVVSTEDIAYLIAKLRTP